MPKRTIKIRLPEGDYLVTKGEILELDGKINEEKVTFQIEGNNPQEKRDTEFEMKLIEKPKSIWCWCRAYDQTGVKMADGYDCTCDLLYEHEGEEVETRFDLKHIGFAEKKK